MKEEYNTFSSGFSEAVSEGSDYCNTLVVSHDPKIIQAAYALTESNLCEMEDLMRDFIDENGNPLGTVSQNPFWRKKSSTTPTNHMPKFNVGDVLHAKRSISSSEIGERQDWSFQPQEEYVVVHLNNYHSFYQLEVTKAFSEADSDDLGRIVNVPYGKESYFISTPSPSMDIIQIVRNGFSWVFGSEEERLLRKTGLKDSCGNFTDKARQAYLETLMNKDVDEEEGVLMEMAEAIEEEMDEEKGKCKC